MQALTLPAPIATFSSTTSHDSPVATSTDEFARSESHLVRGVLFGVALQSAGMAAIAGAWLMVRHF